MAKLERQDGWIEALTAKTRESDKSWYLTFFLSVCFGWLALDRMYAERPFLGFIKALIIIASFVSVPAQGARASCMPAAIGVMWWVTDIGMVACNRMKDGHGDRIRRS